jgi:N utilization substance protein B
MQILYEIDTANHSWEMAVENKTGTLRKEHPAVPFAKMLTAGVLDRQSQIDEMIRRHAPMWPLSQIPAVDKSILRLALHEMLCDGMTPPKVVINEAIEIAKAFGSETSSRFVNGVLGSALENREQESSDGNTD